MSQDSRSHGTVEVLFKNGDKIEVDAVGRVIGADWILGLEWSEKNGNEDELRTKNYVLRSDDIRGIVSDSVTPIGENGLNARLHTPEDPAEHIENAILFDLWKGQHQLHPDDDPSAFEGSENKWPQDDQKTKKEPRR